MGHPAVARGCAKKNAKPSEATSTAAEDRVQTYRQENVVTFGDRGQTIINVKGDLIVTKYDFGGVFGGNINIVENGDQFNIAVDKTTAPGEIRSLLKEIRGTADQSDLPDEDKHTIAAQLAGILAELKQEKPERGRIQKAVDVIKTVAEGAKPVMDVVAKLIPLLPMLF